MKRHSSLLHFTFFTLAIILFLSSCNFRKKENKPYIRPTNLSTLRIGAMSSMDYIPFVVAKKTGIYDSLGVNIEIVKFFSANDRDAAFQSGNIDGTVIDYTGAILQQANGIPLKLIMKNDGFFYFIAGKESNVNSLTDLTGTNIAVSRNTVIDYSTDQFLQAANIKEEEVNKPEINKIPLRLEMLQNNKIEATVLPDPFASIAINNGHHSLMTTKDLDISITGTLFSQKAIEEKAKEIEILIMGYNEAVDYIKKQPLTDWRNILIEDAGVPEHLVKSIQLPNYEKASLPQKKDITQVTIWLKKKNLIPESYSEEQLIDTSFAK
ncbi:MAG: ABC transporter substrate-binding protein [Bacteroidales bacterium]|nr:ABC transporter substrate-binding protein [Bacteroidales bacterium]